MTFKNPKITVYITTFNRLSLLKRAISSVLEQTYSNFELIIVDDFSNDGTQEYLKSLDDCKVSVVLKSQRRGANHSRNLALRKAKGKFITGLDDDDYFLPARLQYFLERYDPKYSFLSSNYYIKTTKNRMHKRFFNRDKDIFLRDMSVENGAGNQIFVETSRLKEIEGFDESLSRLQDMDAFLRLVVKFGRGLRLADASYVMDESHGLPRITNLNGELSAYQDFFLKHRSVMSPSDRLTNVLRLKSYGKKLDVKISYDIKGFCFPNFYPSAKVLLRRALGRLE